MIRDEHCYGSAMTLPHRSLDDRPSKLIFEERINIKWSLDIISLDTGYHSIDIQILMYILSILYL